MSLSPHPITDLLRGLTQWLDQVFAQMQEQSMKAEMVEREKRRRVWQAQIDKLPKHLQGEAYADINFIDPGSWPISGGTSVGSRHGGADFGGRGA